MMHESRPDGSRPRSHDESPSFPPDREPFDPARREAIAIVGIGCRFSGGASSPTTFWKNLEAGIDSVTDVPADRWNRRAFYDSALGKPGKSHAARGGFVEDIDQFDPHFFGISPREAARMDPQQRLLLEVAWEALEDGGQVLPRLAGTRTAVFVGISSWDYSFLQTSFRDRGAIDAYMNTGGTLSIAANRISYCFDFRGPSSAVDTACSSALVAVHLACRSIWTDDAPLALAGGVNVLLAPDWYIGFSRMGMLSPDGRCHAFDARANGFVRSEGAGMVVLKPLSRALADGDRIYALIRGTAVNQDGRTDGMTVPNRESQEELLRRACRDAGVDPSAIQYIEAHGTGTPVGDPIETRAIGDVIGRGRKEPCLIGSVKTNIGHLEAGSGIAGLIKTALALHHHRIPGNLHFEQPNPNIDFQGLRLRVPTALESWPAHVGPALAGVNSFGFGGTNAHVVLQDAPIAATTVNETTANVPVLVPLSARSPESLTALAGSWRELLSTGSEGVSVENNGDKAPSPLIPLPEGEGDKAPSPLTPLPEGKGNKTPSPLTPLPEGEGNKAPSPLTPLPEGKGNKAPSPLTPLPEGEGDRSLHDLAVNAAERRTQHSHRLAIVAGSKAELSDALAEVAAGKSPARAIAGRAGQSLRLAFVCSGQGPQWWAMGRQLLGNEPIFRAAIEACDEIVRTLGPWSLIDELTADEERSRMNETAISQPSIFAIQAALAALWSSWGVRPEAVIGHSVGEVAAAYLAGVFSLEDAVRVIYHRGRCMDRASSHGRMLAVALSVDEARRLVELHGRRVSIAAINAPGSMTLSGEAGPLEEIAHELESRNVFARFLQVQYAFHSAQMDPVRDELIPSLRGIRPQPAKLPIFSTVSGERVEGPELGPEYWWHNVRQTVRFARGVDRLIDLGCDVILELSPHPVLTAAVTDCYRTRGKAVLAIPSLRRREDERATMLRSAAELHVRGYELDWRGVTPGPRRFVRLPAYPWHKQRYWTESEESQATRLVAPVHPLLGLPTHGPRPEWEARLDLRATPYLTDHRVQGVVILPAAAYLEAACAAARERFGNAAYRLERVKLISPCFPPDDGAVWLHTSLASEDGIVRIDSRPTGTSQPEWTTHCQMELSLMRSAECGMRSDSAFDPEAVKARCPRVFERDACYAYSTKLGLNYGPRFQGIERCWQGAKEALGEVVLREATTQDDEYVLHPAILDSCFQVGIVADPIFDHEVGDLYLPMEIEEIRVFRPAGRRLWSHARLIEKTPRVSLCDIDLYDDCGDRVASIRGLRSQKVASAERDRADNLLYAYEWVEKPLSLVSNERQEPPGAWLIFADRGGFGEKLAEKLRSRGDECTLVVPGREFAAMEGDRWQINPAQREDMRRLLESVSRGSSLPSGRGVGGEEFLSSHDSGGTPSSPAPLPEGEGRIAPCRGIIHLWGLDAPASDRLQTSDLEPAHDAILLSALHLVQCWPSRGSGPKPRLLLVTRGAQAVLLPSSSGKGASPFGGEGVLSPSPSGRGVRGEGSHSLTSPSPSLFSAETQSSPTPLPGGEGSNAPSPPTPLPGGEGSNAPSPPTPLPEGEGSVAVAQSPLIGFGRVVVNEYAGLTCKLVDLDPASQADAAQLVTEAQATDDEDEVAWRGAARYVHRFVHTTGEGPAPGVAKSAGPYRLTTTRPGTIDGLTLKSLRRTPPGAGEVEIEVRAAGLNFSDVMKALGLYPGMPEGPVPFGAECSGVITSVGEGVSGWQPGDEVIAVAPFAFASHVVTRAAFVACKPDRLSFEEAATIPIAFLTADYALDHLARLDDGERVLIHSATGGVGLAAIQLARRAGAEVFATAGSPEKREYLHNLGIRHVMDSRSLAFADEVLETTAGRGVDVVLNSLAGEAIPRGIACLAEYGRFLEIGKRDIYQNTRIGLLPFRKNLSFFAIDLDRVMRERPAILGRLLERIVNQVRDGVLDPLPCRVFPIEDAAAAFRYMQHGKHVGKVVVSMAEAPARVAPGDEPITFRDNASYLITGGLGGFGLATARWMVERGARHLVLAGRRGAEAAGVGEAVVELERQGAKVTVAAVHVADEAGVAQLIAAISRDLPPLRGVFHAAMVLEDCLLQNLGTELLRKVLAPKVQGAWNLHQATCDLPLDHFVMFSSLSSVFGHAGQANYAAANAFLDALAWHRRAKGLPGLTINWGHLGEVGYLARRQELSERLERQGVLSFTVAEAMTLLDRAMRRQAIQISVMRVEWSRWNGLGVTGRVSPRFADLLKTVEASRDEHGPSTRTSIRQASPGERHGILGAILKDKLARVLGTSATAADWGASLLQLGIDSLMAVEVVNWIQAEVGIAVPVVELMRSPSVDSLTQLLLDRFPEAEAAGEAAAVPDSAVDNDEPFPLSHGQRALAFLQRLHPDSPALNLSFCSRIHSAVDADAFRRAFQSLIDRHPALRTTIAEHDGELLQHVQRRARVALEFVDAAKLDDDAIRQRIQKEAVRPFDLERGPLLRMFLFTRAATDHVYLLTAHHIIGDFWSLVVLLEEMRTAYPAALAGSEHELPAPATDYRQFVRWQADRLAGDEGERLWAWWQRHLEGAPHILELPADRPRPAAFTHRGGSVACRLDTALTARLKVLAGEERVTLFAVLLSGFQAFLARYTGQDDFVVGSPFAGRPRQEFEGVVGYFINMVPLRARLSDNPSFRTLAQAVSSNVMEAFEYQDYPFARIVERLGVERDPSRTPLIQVSFTLEKAHRRGEAGASRFLLPQAQLRMEIGGLQTEPFPIEQRACQADLEMVLEEHDGAIDGMLCYNADLFDAATADRLAGLYRDFLDAVSASPDVPVSQVAWPNALEHVDAGWNQAHVDFGPSKCLHDLFARQAVATPDAIAVRHQERLVRYGDLDAWSNRLAHELHRNGASAGSMVVVAIERSPEFIAAILGVLKAGAAYVPLDPECPAERIRHVLAETRASVLLAHPQQSERWVEFGVKVLSAEYATSPLPCECTKSPSPLTPLPEGEGNSATSPLPSECTKSPSPLTPLPEGEGNSATSPLPSECTKSPSPLTPLPEGEGNGATSPLPSGRGVGGEGLLSRTKSPSPLTPLPEGEGEAETTPRDLAYVIYTSGSTGKPKGVMVEHAAAFNTVQWRRHALPTIPGDRVLLSVPGHFDASVAVIFPTLLSGAELVLARSGEERQPAALLSRIAQDGATVVQCLPSTLRHLLEEPDFAGACQSVTRFCCGGEPMPPHLPRILFEARPGVEFFNLYGPTEAAVEATYWKCSLRNSEPISKDSKDSEVPSSEFQVPSREDAVVPIGKPIANVRAYVLDSHGQPVPAGVPGELYLGGAGVARGYIGDPELTASRFVADPFAGSQDARMFRTGDRVRRRRDGALEFLGRLDRQVKVGGHRIEPIEIETALRDHPLVRDAVVSVLGENGTARLVAYTVSRNGDVPAAALREHLSGRLPRYMLPSRFVALRTIPRTASGKIDVNALPSPNGDPRRDRRAIVGPRTRLEAFLSETWSELLGGESFDVHDDFFESGGTSLLALVLTSRIRDRLETNVAVSAVFDSPTIVRLARQLRLAHPEDVSRVFGSEELEAPQVSDHHANGRHHANGVCLAAEDGCVAKTSGLHAASAASDLLAPLQPEGNASPLFLVHPPGGIVACYQMLAAQLGRERPIYGIRARGVYGEEDLPGSVEELAAEYVAAARSVQPEGPYLLGGWSLGGVFAYEMAQQLYAEDGSVGLLALLDSTLPFGPANAAYLDGIDQSGSEFGLDVSLEELGAMSADEQLPFLWEHVRRLGLVADDVPPEMAKEIIAGLKRLFHTHVSLAAGYAIRPYPGRITLLRPSDSPVAASPPLDRGWSRLGEVAVHFVPGQHHTMVKPPNVHGLAQTLQECMREISAVSRSDV